MKNNNFWFVSLVALLVIANSTGWSIYSRIAVAANAVVVLMEVAKEAVRLCRSKQLKNK